MQSFTAGQANIVSVDMVAKANTEPITAGVVSLYLQAKSGDNAGKYFKASDASWSVVEAVAGTATHQTRGRWTGTIAAAAWIAGVRYDLSGNESGSLNVPYSDEVVEIIPSITLQEEATVTL